MYKAILIACFVAACSAGFAPRQQHGMNYGGYSPLYTSFGLGTMGLGKTNGIAVNNFGAHAGQVDNKLGLGMPFYGYGTYGFNKPLTTGYGQGYAYGAATPMLGHGLGYNGLGYNGLGYNTLGHNTLGYNGLNGVNGLGHNTLGFNGLNTLGHNNLGYTNGFWGYGYGQPMGMGFGGMGMGMARPF